MAESLFTFIREANHIFTVWHHIALLTLRQYGNKSYRRFAEWLEEASNLPGYLQLKGIPHFTTVPKFPAKIYFRFTISKDTLIICNCAIINAASRH